MNTARLPIDPARPPASTLALWGVGVGFGSRPRRVQPFTPLCDWMRDPATA